MASEFAAGLPGAARCLVAHPGNPPLMIRVIELVPAPFTGAAAVDAAAALLGRAGLSVVRLQKEIKGFVFNRLQGAVLREAYCLVRDGVAQVEDIDRLVRDGLGLRWSVIGPFETADLNRRGGIAGHAAIMGEAYAAMGAERGQNDPWTPELVAKVDAERRALLPLEHWDERVHWRDRQLMKALAAKRAGE
jgi:3-hydroxyacyl-CoA dehydrogenase